MELLGGNTRDQLNGYCDFRKINLFRFVTSNMYNGIGTRIDAGYRFTRTIEPQNVRPSSMTDLA
jgi:hypothetical protein